MNKDKDMVSYDIKQLSRFFGMNRFETLSSNILTPLIVGYPYLPFSRACMDNHSLVVLINDIIINKRESIIEFGGGISTLLIARLIKLNCLDTRIITVENNQLWAKEIENMLLLEGLNNFVEVVYIPLDTCSIIPDHNMLWYSFEKLEYVLDKKEFDMVVVDGPVAFKEEIKYARLPAAFYMKDKLTSDYSIFLHDSNRQGEQEILSKWDCLLEINRVYFTSKMAGYISNPTLEINI